MPRFSIHDFSRGAIALMKALIFAMSLAVFLWLTVEHYHGDIFVLKGYYILVIIYAAIYILLGLSFEAFKVGLYSPWRLFFFYILSILITNMLSYGILSMARKRLLAVSVFLVMSLIQSLLALPLYFLADRLYYHLNPARDCLLILSGAAWEMDVARKFTRQRRRYVLREIRDENADISELKAAVLRHNSLILGNVRLQLKQELMAFCFVHKKRLYVMPTSEDVMINSATGIQIDDSLVYLCKNRSFTLEQLLIKRLLDIFFSVLLLVLTLPITLPVALAIKLYDRGPIFFRQRRYTRQANVFTMIKFRSMVVDAERNGAQLTVPGDKRITPIGRVIRKLRIDELPQLLNVLEGSMSIVGPRAERLETSDLYIERLPEFAYRLQVKAGITGYAQIYGRYNTSFEDKARMDLYYVVNASLLMDLKIMLSTLRVLFSRESTQGFQSQDLNSLCQPPRPKQSEEESRE